MQIKDKKAIIIGPVNRLGIAFCRELLRNGAGSIIILDDQQIAAKNAVEEINQEFGQKRVIWLPCDISKNELDAAFKEAVSTLGGLDILINNVDLINESDIMKAVDVNVTAVIRGTLLGIQQMGKDLGGKGGIVVNVASVLGFEPLPQLPIYSTTKQAVISFSRSLAQPYHYQRTGVKIIVLSPGVSGSSLRESLETLEAPAGALGPVTVHPQRVETVAHGLVYAIRCAQNGSIWVSEDGQPVYEIQPPDVLPQKQNETDLSDFETLASQSTFSRGSSYRQVLPKATQIIAMESLITKSRRASAEEKAKELEIIKGLVCGKNVVITGGAAGLGYAFVNHFLQNGAKTVVIIDIDAAAGERAVKAVAKSYGGRKIIFLHADTSNYSQVLDAFKYVSTIVDSIDIVVNNAGILDERRWEREIAVNIGGMITVATLAMRFMSKDQGGNGGVLVNIAQYFDFTWTAQLPVYTATKYAIIGLSQSLGAPYHYERTGVRVMALCPGLTETALTVDSPNRLLSKFMKADFVKNLEQMPIQTPFIVSEGLMSILKCGDTGSIWAVENGKTPFEISIPHYSTQKRRYKNNLVISNTVEKVRGRPLREVCDSLPAGLTGCA
ncbi:peroxisomal hydratase-dehydrogenase-epimerase [Diachasma alloeum]|uniref:peroxisomal hydratase-dehydrogenase-epimerase n=1 Tax=Diachasma alloeum TaxID=454923 RepID=UPI000738187C|nr:peroxisomal hydratase-dehydrogenase-epimerase [Diachasma alloeum]